MLFLSGKLAAGRICEKFSTNQNNNNKGAHEKARSRKKIKERWSERRQPVNFFSIEILY
jgi:hypothetical protein